MRRGPASRAAGSNALNEERQKSPKIRPAFTRYCDVRDTCPSQIGATLLCLSAHLSAYAGPGAQIWAPGARRRARVLQTSLSASPILHW